MIYTSISTNSIEIIQTAKGLFDREEKITACSRKVLKDGESPGVTLNEALKTAYPAAITQSQARLVVSDKDIIVNRFPVAVGSLTSEVVVEKAKKILPHDISQYENFYKEINNQNGKSVLFTALPLSTIKYYLQILTPLGLKLNFLSTMAFGCDLLAGLQPWRCRADVSDARRVDWPFIWNAVWDGPPHQWPAAGCHAHHRSRPVEFE